MPNCVSKPSLVLPSGQAMIPTFASLYSFHIIPQVAYWRAIEALMRRAEVFYLKDAHQSFLNDFIPAQAQSDRTEERCISTCIVDQDVERLVKLQKFCRARPNRIERIQLQLQNIKLCSIVLRCLYLLCHFLPSRDISYSHDYMGCRCMQSSCCFCMH